MFLLIRLPSKHLQNYWPHYLHPRKFGLYLTWKWPVQGIYPQHFINSTLYYLWNCRTPSLSEFLSRWQCMFVFICLLFDPHSVLFIMLDIFTFEFQVMQASAKVEQICVECKFCHLIKCTIGECTCIATDGISFNFVF